MTSHEIAQLRADMEALQNQQEMISDAFRQVDGEAHQALAVAKSNIKLMSTLRATQLEHSQVLDEHSRILNEHSGMLAKLNLGVDSIAAMLKILVDRDSQKD